MEITQPAVAPAAVAGMPAGVPATNLIPPPDLHWALLLLLMFVTCGFFGIVWMFIQANWVRRIDPDNKAIVLYSIYMAGVVIALALAVSEDQSAQVLSGLVNIAGVVCGIVGYFKLRSGLHDYYGGPPIHLYLGPVMTFFFNTIYFQYHFTRINEWHKTGMLRA